ncbi:MAG: HAMP domain-containing protein [Clostridiales bacterium]|nr:HAMP domain-containing protein [Clostridiales bacterium]
MKIGIKKKIFIFTSSLFIIVLVILLLIQSFVIGDFFQRRQLNAIENAVNDLVSQTFESDEADREIYRLASEFSLRHNTPFVIIDPEKSFFEQLHSPSNTLLVQTDEGQVFNLVIDGFNPDELNRFDDGKWIEFSGFRMDEQNLRAFFIETEGAALDLENTYRNSDMPIEEFEEMMSEFADRDVISGHGEIIFNNTRNLDTQASQKLIGYHSDQIEAFLMEYGLESFFDSDELRIYDFEDEWASTHNRLIVRPIFFPDGKDYLLIAIISMSNTESIVSIFQEFYWVNFAIAIVICFIATFFYANRFSKPIQDMESIAKDMVNMDFSRQIKIDSKDEIGSLANSLNMLSKALEDKILALENANTKLTDEIEFKTQQEEIRKTFVANVSHELKTPITIMKGILEGIKEGLYDDPTHLQSALDEANRMERLVFDMLEISKYEAKGIELTPSIFCLDESVNRIYRRFKNIATRKGVNLTFHLDEGFVNADQEKLELVLENLISNAIRYCNNYGNITIQTNSKSDSIYFAITNDGPEIQEEAMESIWKPFYRVETSRNRAKGGTGLGLVIVKTILEAHNAGFGVMNTPEGVCFWFEISRVIEL